MLIVGLLPALQISRGVSLAPNAQGTWTVGDRGRRLRETFVGAVALAMVLLVAAGLLARSFWTLTRVDPGFAAVGCSQAPVEGFTLIVRAATPIALTASLRDAVQRIDPELPVRSIGVASDAIDASVTEPRTRTFLFNALVSAGLLLVVLGIYGVVSYSVARDTREIGLRLALGAQPTAFVGGIVRRGMAVVAGGAAFGLMASFAVTRTLGGILFGITPTDPLTFLVVTALLVGVAFIASYVPARAQPDLIR